MIKLFVTGDIHFGKKYDRYPEIRDRLIQSRFACLERCVREAERQRCDFFVITGDLFDNTASIRQSDVQRAVEILALFGGRVLVLPGNHDFYTGEEKVWKDFRNAMNGLEHNIHLIDRFRPLRFEAGEETVTFYPAFCQSKHSPENNLGWIKAQSMDGGGYRVGLAHGAIAGLTPDMKNEYFLMTERELNAIGVDVWLIGHTHIPFPAELPTEGDALGYTIFNPGTPEQTDLSNRSSGVCFVVTLDRAGGRTTVAAHAYQSGAIRFFDLRVPVGEAGLGATVTAAASGLPENSVVRLTLQGTVPEEEYARRQHIYGEALDRFLSWEVEDEGLCERITREKIRAEFAQIGFAARLLESLTDPRELQMAYELVRKHQEVQP